MIREGFGKILAIAQIASSRLGRHLGTRPETHLHIHTSLIRLGLGLKAPLTHLIVLPKRVPGLSGMNLI